LKLREKSEKRKEKKRKGRFSKAKINNNYSSFIRSILLFAFICIIFFIFGTFFLTNKYYCDIL